MRIHEAFDKTLKNYRISGKLLAERTNIRPAHISQFRNNKGGLSYRTLEEMLDALEEIAPGSRTYFCLQLADYKQSVEKMVEGMDSNQKGDLMLVLAKSFKSYFSSAENGSKQKVKVSAWFHQDNCSEWGRSRELVGCERSPFKAQSAFVSQ